MAELVLVTGGAGFIGSHLCEGLLRAGYQVRVLDNLTTGTIENIPSGCQFLQGSILDEEMMLKALQDVNHVCHEAARVTIRGSVDRFVEDANTNLMGTLQLMRLSARKNIRRFIYASSMAVYSDSDRPIPLSEDYPSFPVSPYGISKLAAERYLLMLGPLLGIEPVVLRYFNTFGIRQRYTPYVGVITIFVTRLLQKKGITIFGDGNQTRDFVPVSDIVQANISALASNAANGMIFNIGTGKGTTVNELAELLKSRLYPDAPVRYETARKEELRNSIADISTARRILNFQPQILSDHLMNQVIEDIQKTVTNP